MPRWVLRLRWLPACRLAELGRLECSSHCPPPHPRTAMPLLTPPPLAPRLQYERLGMSSHYKVFEAMFTGY